MPKLPEPGFRHNFDHVLTRLHRKMGYKLVVRDNVADKRTLEARLMHGGKQVGYVFGAKENHSPWGEGPSLYVESTLLNKEHRGKGLGFRMYEALMGHAYHKHGLKSVRGGVHSAMAHAVHERIAKKYGIKYQANKIRRDAEIGMYNAEGEREDVKMARGHYAYAFKSEVQW